MLALIMHRAMNKAPTATNGNPAIGVLTKYPSLVAEVPAPAFMPVSMDTLPEPHNAVVHAGGAESGGERDEREGVKADIPALPEIRRDLVFPKLLSATPSAYEIILAAHAQVPAMPHTFVCREPIKKREESEPLSTLDYARCSQPLGGKGDGRRVTFDEGDGPVAVNSPEIDDSKPRWFCVHRCLLFRNKSVDPEGEALLEREVGLLRWNWYRITECDESRLLDGYSDSFGFLSEQYLSTMKSQMMGFPILGHLRRGRDPLRRRPDCVPVRIRRKFGDLAAVRKKWCSASRAKFDIASNTGGNKGIRRPGSRPAQADPERHPATG
ncbi:hypothetical protein BDZ89DRAFT_1045305 [Hymenopellis radicata]|nr:hypothetical protein BDZ89DRAFT_1045305 [Hymenopellis radicata]